MQSWAWAAAACKGTSHEKTGVRLQDAFVCSSVKSHLEEYFFGVISDGAGSADYGGQGASIICNTVSRAIKNHQIIVNGFPPDSTIETWVDTARDLIFQASEKRGLSPRDFAATLLCVISNGDESLVIHVGDGCVVLKEENSGDWIAPTWPEQGEFASTTFFVTDEFGLRLRINRHTERISAIALFSDGLERLALDFQQTKPFNGFLEGMIKPLTSSTHFGKDKSLSTALKSYLNSDAINSRTDDDKSLIIATRK